MDEDKNPKYEDKIPKEVYFKVPFQPSILMVIMIRLHNLRTLVNRKFIASVLCGCITKCSVHECEYKLRTQMSKVYTRLD